VPKSRPLVASSHRSFTNGKGNYRSKISTPTKHKLVVKGLGFTRLNQVVEREDTPSIRGMVKTVPHLVRIVE